MSHPVTVAILLCLVAHPSVSLWGDKVKLTDVRVLTLRQGYYTTGRRSHPVPQLHCRGGSAGCKHQPSVVQCYNRGTDGWDVQWECKAEMKETQKFGWMQVSCEGYDHRKDEYVLVGSCGLEYYLERTGSGKGSLFWANLIFWALAVLSCCWFCLICCSASRTVNNRRYCHTCHNHQDAPSCCAAYQPLINQPATYPSAPPPAPHPQGNPPPYYLNYAFASQNPNADSGRAPTSRRRSSSEGPDFVAGAVTGAVLGYLYAESGTDAATRSARNAPAENPDSHPARDSSSDRSTTTGAHNESREAVTSTGFAGTERR